MVILPLRRTGLVVSPYWIIYKLLNCINYIGDLYVPTSDDSRDGFDFGRLLSFGLPSCISSAFLHVGLHWDLVRQFNSTRIYRRLHSVRMLILLASDGGVQCSGCHRMHIPKNFAAASVLIAGWAAASPCLPGISSSVLSEWETLNPPMWWRKPATLPLLGGTRSFIPPVTGCGFLTKPILFPRLCNFVLFGARTHWI